MVDYKFITDTIEVRASEENKKPRYIVNGTAILADKPAIKKWIKNKD